MTSSHNHGTKPSNNAKAGDIDTSKAPTTHTHAYATSADIAAAITAHEAEFHSSQPPVVTTPSVTTLSLPRVDG